MIFGHKNMIILTSHLAPVIVDLLSFLLIHFFLQTSICFISSFFRFTALNLFFITPTLLHLSTLYCTALHCPAEGGHRGGSI